jgi:glucose-6-phosphate isomerase
LDAVDVTALAAWSRCEAHVRRLADVPLARMFAADPGRAARGTLTLHDGADEILVDVSKQRIDSPAFEDLMTLAREAGVPEAMVRTRAGEPVNTTEQVAAMHEGLRAAEGEPVVVGGRDFAAEVAAERRACDALADAVRSGTARGATGRPFTRVVNLGIGGSDLGPALVTRALAARHAPTLDVRFAANVDPEALDAALAGADPAETLVVVCSKSMSTAETMVNARRAAAWLAAGVGAAGVGAHTVVVTARPERVGEAGLGGARVLRTWPWVGGRFSVASAVGLAPTIALGPAVMAELRAGMRAVDRHAATAPPERNVPLVLGMLGVWQGALGGAASLAVVPYADALDLLPAYLQQLVMESLGKSVRLDGGPVGAATAPVLWGTTGTQGQHAYFQALHQGTQVVPVEFVGVSRPVRAADPAARGAHDDLVAAMFAQAAALAFGTGGASADPLAAHRATPGDRPSTTILAPALTARTLGALIALWEHRVVVQAAALGINPFDQWGVELGKSLARDVRGAIDGVAAATDALDASTRALVERHRRSRA